MSSKIELTILITAFTLLTLLRFGAIVFSPRRGGRDYLELVRNATQRMSQIIDDL